MTKTGRFKLLIRGVTGLLVITTASVAASSANISRSFLSSAPIPRGSLVSVEPQANDHVGLANVNNGSQLIGVAVATSDSLIAVDAANGKVQVATSGSAPVLVSTLNGDIKAGDKVAVSPFNGIGMKAPAGAKIIGSAASSFNRSSTGASPRQVTDRNGKTNQIYVGFASVNINIGVNSTGTSNAQVNNLQRVVKALTGRVVPTYRVVISLVVIAVALLTLITLTYGAIYGSIISIGRNPLAKHAIFRTLGSVLGMIIVTAATATITVVLLLK